MNYFERIANLETMQTSAHARRICAQIRFCAYMSKARGGVFDAQIDEVLKNLLRRAQEEGSITPEAAEEAENALLPLSPEAKKYRVHLAAHAHIDMNWLWGYEETAAVTVGTFRTMLKLLERYPSFRFSQSQASTYEIIENYAPELLAPISDYVRQGRWELSGSTWVENDENMPSCESLARQMLYTRRFYKRLFGSDAPLPEIDFSPDTFGHNAMLPDICAAGGVRWFYHCRGNDGTESLYRWRGQGPSELLCFCDPCWYAMGITEELFDRIPGFCEKYGVNTWLTVYGVGDHGGGPSARDIERITEIAQMPLMPTLIFSTYSAFFSELEQYREKLPVRSGECNFVFSGCYTSKSEIKRQNAACEARLRDAEALSAMAGVFARTKSDSAIFADAWKKLLFMQFHDILPGSGLRVTGEGASGDCGRILAAASCRSDAAMRAICGRIALPGLPDAGFQGGGSGFGIDDRSRRALSVHPGGGGKKRAYALFNTGSDDYEGTVELNVWNWAFDPGRAVFTALNGERLRSSVKNAGSGYWGAEYKTFLVCVRVPALGYTTVILDEEERASLPGFGAFENRVLDMPAREIVLENDRIRAIFDRRTAELLSVTDKESGKELPVRAHFEERREDARVGMQAWKEGFLLERRNLSETCDVRITSERTDELESGLSYRFTFGSGSVMRVSVCLRAGEKTLRYAADVDYREQGDGGTTPRLDFVLDTDGTARTCYYGAQLGIVERPELPHDVPAFFACPAGKGTVPALLAFGKYGYRFDKGELSTALLRASSYPDPLPEYGGHRIDFALSFTEAKEEILYALHERLNREICVCPIEKGNGDAPACSSLMHIENARLIAVKRAEDRPGLIFRLAGTDTKEEAQTELRFTVDVKTAEAVDLHEQTLSACAVNGKSVFVPARKGALVSVYVEF